MSLLFQLSPPPCVKCGTTTVLTMGNPPGPSPRRSSTLSLRGNSSKRMSLLLVLALLQRYHQAIRRCHLGAARYLRLCIQCHINRIKMAPMVAATKVRMKPITWIFRSVDPPRPASRLD
jgi:hypothetical protein